MAKSRANNQKKSSLREEIAKYDLKYGYKDKPAEITKAVTKKDEYEDFILQELYKDAVKSTTNQKRGTMISLIVVSEDGGPKQEIDDVRIAVYENYLNFLEHEKIIDSKVLSYIPRGFSDQYIEHVALVTFYPQTVIEFTHKVKNRKNNNWVDFNTENGFILFGTRKYKVEFNTLQFRLCEVLFRDLGARVSSGEIADFLEQEGIREQDVKPRAYVDALRKLNERIKSELDIPKLFYWERGRFWVKQTQ